MKRSLTLFLLILCTSLVMGITLKSGTRLRMDEYLSKGALSRPDLPFYIESDNFRIWYDTSGYHAVEMIDTLPPYGIPDFVGLALEFMEYAYWVQCESLGFDPPLPDSTGVPGASNVGGDDRWDVYLRNYGRSYYGATSWCYVFPRSNKATGFIEINTRLRELPGYEDDPYSALAVTCAHEFHHLVQFAYYSDRGLIWQMEACAVFMEDVCFPDVNDYYAYLHHFLDHQAMPLVTVNGRREYGSVLWPIFLSERYGIDIIRRWWELTESNIPLTSLRATLLEYDTDMDTEFTEFCRWNMMIGNNHVEGFGYSDGANYPLPGFERVLEMNINQGHDTTIFDDISGPYSCKHYKIPLVGSLRRASDYDSGVWSSLDDITFPQHWGILGSGIKPDGSTGIPYHCDTVAVAFATVESLNVGIDEIWRYTDIVIAPIILHDSGNPFALRINATGNYDRIETEFGIPYPNPVERGERIHFPFVLAEKSEVFIAVFDNSGSPVYTNSNIFFAGQHTENPFWDTQDTAPGIYHYKLILPDDDKKGTIIVR